MLIDVDFDGGAFEPEREHSIVVGVNRGEVTNRWTGKFAPQTMCFGHYEYRFVPFFFQQCAQNGAEPPHTLIVSQTLRFLHGKRIVWLIWFSAPAAARGSDRPPLSTRCLIETGSGTLDTDPGLRRIPEIGMNSYDSLESVDCGLTGGFSAGGASDSVIASPVSVGSPAA